MTRSKSPLWLSGTLLILAYSAFGWLSVNWQMPKTRWFVLITMTLMVDLVAAYPDRLFNVLFKGIFGAEARSLFLVMGLATMAVLILTWLPIFTYLLLLLCAALLFTMDIHDLGLSRGQILVLLLICQAVGLGLGFGGNIVWWRAVHYWPHLHRMVWSYGI